MPAFLEAMFLSAPNQLRIDHITALLALLTGEPLRAAVLYPSYTPANVTYIWSIWEPHIKPPSIHPLAEGTLAKDTVLSLLHRA
jgi:hypothetical protein